MTTGLLSRQLEDIRNTLIKASDRREPELRNRAQLVMGRVAMGENEGLRTTKQDVTALRGATDRECSAMTRLVTVHHETCELVELEAMLPEIKGSIPESGQELSRGVDGDFEFARGGPFHSLDCQPTPYAGSLSPEIAPYAVALMLETSSCKWEHVKSRSTYLFSSNTDESHDKRELENMIRNENGCLIGHGGYVTGEEDKKRQLTRRLIIYNLAADVDEKSILVFLAKYRSNLLRVTLLSERDPVKGTRTAHVDMDSRRAAVYASFHYGHIFGLMVKTKLAVE
ncbi:hypothetical protein COCMIDRAFT_5490 [Bipolaris oryzae ATCC 44560]|uniref:Uncharacterized protein n=1 Tax=Bipolaris oryzae ATCC 44560 TaxID=930090 RepID=W6Z5P0_COCMI|nr:uncharacterized protein COCMIDRAFT_5490 [Bipolaris oryzae ATCC 44560]EUC45285.1 hypothetical protein COCMIDRAFT_5490 [Bipolaris oryzae ATCC 44560]